MTNHEDALGRSIAKRLDDGLGAIDKETLLALSGMRKKALTVQRREKSFAWARDLVGIVSGGSTGFRQISPAQLVILAFLLLSLVAGIAYWQVQVHKIDELADVDAGLLAGDLPIDAYLDKGLDSWLTRSHQ